MILSVHIPKAAGNTLGSALADWYGARIKRDYGDASGYDEPRWNARRAERKAVARKRKSELLADADIIHGHFVADKYADLFPDQHFVAFFREPFAQTVSQYEFLRRSENLKNPVVKHMADTDMSLEEFIEWEPVANPQSQFLGTVPLEEFSVVALTEEFDRGLELFNAVLGARVRPGRSENVNPNKRVAREDVSPDIARRIKKHRERDIELFERVKLRYAALCDRFDI